MKSYKLQIIFILFIIVFSSCKKKEKTPFQDGLENYPTLQKVLSNPEKYKVQILYTQVDRNEHGIPMFKVFSFHLNDSNYFYPASTVKLPVALFALEWLNEQNVDNLDRKSTLFIDSVRPSQKLAYVDKTSIDSLPSISNYIKKILLVSDNDAFNRLYEVMGLDYINDKFKDKNLTNSVISQRLSIPISSEENKYFNPLRFVDKSGNTILELPERHTENNYFIRGKPKIGKAHFSGDSLVQKPMDFTFKNKFALSDLDAVLKRILFPRAFFEAERFQISEEQRNFVLKYMSMKPRESEYPFYPVSEYPDSYSKFYKFGTSNDMIPSRFRIFNKTGWSYGFLIDGSYFVDFKNGVEFFVSAVVYSNEDEILNDDNYEYEEIGKPFFAELGDYLYQLELNRKKLIKPDLSSIKFDY